jgi:predicted metal-dependent HD superfamily phosphohydrolase
MGVSDAPQWLLPSFVRSVTAAGATATLESAENVGVALLDRWHDPTRVFHTIQHLVDVLARVDQLAEETHQPDLVRLAAWYHSSAYRPGVTPTHNITEIESARIALAELRTLHLPEPSARRVHDLIVALSRHLPPAGDLDAAVLSDADLAVLATDPQTYQDYAVRIRAEHAHLSAPQFRAGRIGFISAMLARPVIFHSAQGAVWENAARQNMEAELVRLRKAAANGSEPPHDT